MSEYQYYEFRTIGSTLSDAAMEAMSALSSRAKVSRTSASFTYSYGDFPADPVKLLTKYFDALLYAANWGSRRLMFRFPISTINYEAFSRFELGEMINVERKGGHLIVDLLFEDECDWIEAEGTLDRLLELYDDLLAEDYRPLFLPWLQAVYLKYGWEPDADLPPIPPGLNQLSERHRGLIELFEIDIDLVAAATSFSGPIRGATNEELAHQMESMPAGAQTDFLKRMVLGEPTSMVLAELRGQLRREARFAEEAIAEPLTAPASTSALFAKARQIQTDRERKESERERALELKRLNAIERDEKGLWQRVDQLIAGKTIKAYDEAIGILKNLRDLAIHKKRREEFASQVEAILGKYPRLLGLKNRIRDEKLLEKPT
jgi:hypothetical protein